MQILSIGTDIVECLRIAQMIERHGELFITRVYTDAEIEYCRSRMAATQHYAGRWAGKEAVLKALRTGLRRGIHWRDIEIIANRDGQPTVRLHGAARELMEVNGISRWHVSISHCRTHAVGYAIAEAKTNET